MGGNEESVQAVLESKAPGDEHWRERRWLPQDGHIVIYLKPPTLYLRQG